METLNLSPDPRLQPAPERTAFDYAVSAARVGGLAFPFLGAGATLFDLVTAPLRGKRLNNWLEELRLRLNELSQKVAELTPESLAASDAFVSAFAHATQAALRTHQAEKLEALRNGLLNVAVGTAPHNDQQLIFLHLIDRFTPTHIQVLRYFHSRDQANLARFREQQELSDQAVRDLHESGLLADNRPYVARNRDMPEALVYYPWEVTNVGKQFMDFISAPHERKP